MQKVVKKLPKKPLRKKSVRKQIALTKQIATKQFVLTNQVAFVINKSLKKRPITIVMGFSLQLIFSKVGFGDTSESVCHITPIRFACEIEIELNGEKFRRQKIQIFKFNRYLDIVRQSKGGWVAVTSTSGQNFNVDNLIKICRSPLTFTIFRAKILTASNIL